MTLRDYDWKRVYESNFRGHETLVSAFYQPMLSEAVQYDRLAGYLSLQNLADALQGIESAFESNGEIRLIASKRLSQENKPVLTDSAPLSEEGESRLALIAQMMDEGRLELKIGEPQNNSESGIFHPKLGIATDADENRITFEGSINETYNAWYRNYERFKVHRSWDEVEAKYVEEDVATFERLWNEEHEDVDVTTIDEAIEEDILDWQPESDEEIQEHVERLEKAREPPASEATVAKIADERSFLPGALHMAEDISPIEPWPHQRVIADTAASIYPESLLFCDEVGLGKTIEAGLTLSRLISIGEVSDALLLVPATVQPQWQEELLEKFNINAFSYEYSGAQRVLRDAYGVEHTLSDYEATDGWRDSHIGEFVSERDDPTVVLASWHTARRTQNKGLFSPTVHWQTDHAGVPEDVEKFEWDLTLVDEAHHGREGTNLYDLLTELRNDAACMYILTATPMQLEITELFDLLRLCNLPEGWNKRESFDRYFEVQQELEEALDEVGGSGSKTVEEVLPDISSKWNYEPYEGMVHLQTWAGMIQSFVQEHDDVADRVDEEIDEAGFSLSERRRLHRVLGTGRLGTRNWEDKFSHLSADSLRFLLQLGQKTTPVHSRVFRNTRHTLRMCSKAGLLDENIPRRDIEVRSVSLGDAEPLYERVESYISDVYNRSKQLLEGKEKTAIGFVMTTYRQRLTSSLHAIEQSLQRRRENLRSDLRDVADISDSDLRTGALADREEILQREYGISVDEIGVSGTAGERVRQFELGELEDFIAQLYDVPEDPKLEQLIQDLQKLSARARDTVIVFTQYKDTLDAVKEKVRRSRPDVGTYSGDGGEIFDSESGEWKNSSKERVKREFTDPDGDLSILICTDSASEGLNLQTCDALINYDLPWNPMKVEQRIGRIDRIGQTNEEVLVWNYVYKDTVEEDIYDRLGERIQLFEQAVGPLRPILEGLEGEVKNAALGESSKSGNEIASDAEEMSEEAKEMSERVGLTQDISEVDAKDIIEKARLDGWTDPHPDINRIGYPDRGFDPILKPEVVKRLFTQSQALRNRGWSFEMLDRQLTEEEDAPYKKLYRLKIPADANPPISDNPPEDTVQALYAESGEVLVSFDPTVLEWYPSVVVLLPQHELFEYLLDELLGEVGGSNESEVTRVVGRFENGSPEIWADGSIDSSVEVATHATEAKRRISLGIPLPTTSEAEEGLSTWLRNKHIPN
ncbi:helicase-related protein [Haloferax volcanii]|uniref:helicase-related protein n=1 Tax=Haloferax volcanii TaxID=2246 RepID=UPI00349F1E3C